MGILHLGEYRMSFFVKKIKKKPRHASSGRAAPSGGINAAAMRATETSSPFFFVLPPFSSQLAFLFVLFIHSMLERKKQKCQEYFVPQHARRMWIGSAEKVCVVKGANSLPLKPKILSSLASNSKPHAKKRKAIWRPVSILPKSTRALDAGGGSAKENPRSTHQDRTVRARTIPSVRSRRW
jgi:hypothetical protein